MSSILKALKKAEQNSSKKDLFSGLTTTPRRFYSPINPGGSENIFHRYKRIWICFGAVLIVGFSCFLFFQLDAKQHQEPPAYKSPGVQAKKEIKQEKKASSSSPVHVADTLPSRLKPEAIPEPKSSPQPVPTQKPVLANEEIPEVEPDISLPEKTADLPVIPKDETPTKEDIVEIKDKEIKIQAISWSQTPEDRIAVINNKIVSEKDSIQEYRIVRINKDEIILSRSGKQYLLKFNYH